MAGSETRIERQKYLSLKEHLAEFIDNNRRLKRAWCPLIDWLKRQPDNSLDDVIAAELFMQSHPEWGPGYCCDVIRDTWRYNAPDDVALIQHDHVLALTRHPWLAARKPIEALLGHDEIVWRSPEALALLLRYFIANHPNPKAFLATPDVLSRLPSNVDISELPCPDFPHLQAHSVAGLAPPIGGAAA